jgi:hypothetical protein
MDLHDLGAIFLRIVWAELGIELRPALRRYIASLDKESLQKSS